MGKSTISTGPFSIAMLVYQMVTEILTIEHGGSNGIGWGLNGISWDLMVIHRNFTAKNGMYPPVIQPSYQYGKWMNIAHLAP